MKRKTYRQCHGATILESMIAICVMLLLFFGLLQIYKWCMAQSFCHYGSFYGAKGVSLGYQLNIALRGVRVGAASICGTRSGESAKFEASALRAYMSYGDASGVRYEYWHPQTPDAPYLDVRSQNIVGEVLDCRTQLVRMPLLSDFITNFVFAQKKDKKAANQSQKSSTFLVRNPEPKGVVESFNFSEIGLNYEK